MRRLPLAAVLLLLALAARADELERFVSGPLPSSDGGERFAIGFPSGWDVTLRGERTRAIPWEEPSRRSPDTYVEVLAIARDEPGSERLLNEAGGLEKWLAALYRTLSIDSRAKWKIAGEEREVLFLREAQGPLSRELRAIAVQVTSGDVHFVLFAAAPEKRFAGLHGIFQQVFQSFEVRT